MFLHIFFPPPQTSQLPYFFLTFHLLFYSYLSVSTANYRHLTILLHCIDVSLSTQSRVEEYFGRYSSAHIRSLPISFVIMVMRRIISSRRIFTQHLRWCVVVIRIRDRPFFVCCAFQLLLLLLLPFFRIPLLLHILQFFHLLFGLRRCPFVGAVPCQSQCNLLWLETKRFLRHENKITAGAQKCLKIVSIYELLWPWFSILGIGAVIIYLYIYCIIVMAVVV